MSPDWPCLSPVPPKLWHISCMCHRVGLNTRGLYQQHAGHSLAPGKKGLVASHSSCPLSWSSLIPAVVQKAKSENLPVSIQGWFDLAMVALRLMGHLLPRQSLSLLSFAGHVSPSLIFDLGFFPRRCEYCALPFPCMVWLCWCFLPFTFVAGIW